MKELNRTKVGIFNINDAVTIEEIEEHINDEAFFKDKIITMEKLYKNNDKIKLNSKELLHFINGVKINVKKEDGIYNIYEEEKYIGIGIVKGGLLKRDILII